MSTRPVQRVGHIGHTDNRFCGAAVFAELARQIVDPAELLALACGVRTMAAVDRDAVRVVALALTSPDARVWPLRLARTLACHGNPYAGMFGAQLINHNRRMGPGVISGAAAMLVWLRARTSDGPDDGALDDALGEFLADHDRLAGCGVPLRDRDERLLAVHVLLADHAAAARPTWRYYQLVVAAVRRRGVEPNVALTVAALLLDVGLAPSRCGPFASLMIAHTFTAHALEAADHDGPWLRCFPEHAVDDRSPALRLSPPAAAAKNRPPGGASGARRSLAW
jgi:hypothetical protein